MIFSNRFNVRTKFHVIGSLILGMLLAHNLHRITQAADGSIYAAGPDVVLAMHFDEGHSNPQDSSMWGNHGKNLGAVWVDSKFGKALRFDGTNNSYVNCGNSESLNLDTGDFTIEAWIKNEGSLDHTEKFYDIVSKKARNNCYYAGFQLWLRGGKGTRNQTGVEFRINNGKQENDLVICPKQNVIPLLTNGSWRHLVCTVARKGNVTFYIDGVSKDGDSISAMHGSLNNDLNLCIGSDSSEHGHNFKGLIDEVRIYKRVLSAEEVKQQYMANASDFFLHSAQKANIPPVIDGNLTDPIWQTSTREEIVLSDVRAGAFFSAAYDKQNLYFAVEAQEPQHR